MRQEKQLLLDEVKEKIQGSKGFIIARYQTFTADKAREFRDLVAKASGEFEVVRKRVFVKAAEEAGYKIDPKECKGHVGVIFAHDDTLALSKATLEYGESNGKAIEILAGVVDGTLCSGEEVVAIAKLPSLPELRAQILSVLVAPHQQTLGVIESALTSILHGIEEKTKKESSI